MNIRGPLLPRWNLPGRSRIRRRGRFHLRRIVNGRRCRGLGLEWRRSFRRRLRGSGHGLRHGRGRSGGSLASAIICRQAGRRHIVYRQAILRSNHRRLGGLWGGRLGLRHGRLSRRSGRDRRLGLRRYRLRLLGNRRLSRSRGWRRGRLSDRLSAIRAEGRAFRDFVAAVRAKHRLSSPYLLFSSTPRIHGAYRYPYVRSGYEITAFVSSLSDAASISQSPSELRVYVTS